MRQTIRTRAAAPGAHQGPWLGILLICSLVLLFLQLFPTVGWTVGRVLDVRNWSWAKAALWWVVSVGDVRNWTWKAYATFCATAIVVLVTVKARRG